ncbi:hypothetical protein AVME950_02210 [Acidovorax sp. SUPP950]|uniref:hypothetical protein n=1 Tax=Acidovorax sp. SUPP950 TaxID=511901 RepID=UPI0023C1F4F6|nr:hypothetical protein [Acidovorax sp. SUPP950]GKS73660.1 hypothetical protein AVME950_02210 [Acidovorax sp. SUPP950]
MSTSFVEFAQTVLAEATTLESTFAAQAGALATRYNVPLTTPAAPRLTDEPMYRGDQFSTVSVAPGLGSAVPPALTNRRIDFAALGSAEYSGTVQRGKTFFDKWFGTPTTDQLLSDALAKLEGGTVSGLMEDYIALNQQEANEIRHRLMLAHHRQEDEILAAGVRQNTPRMSGAVYNQIAVLKERTHEAIRDELRKLGGEGLQREFALMLGLIEERLRLNHDAKRALARWVSAVDDPLYAAQASHDDAALRGAAAAAEQVQAVAAQLANFDQRGLALASTALGAKRDLTFAPVVSQLDKTKLQLDYLVSDLQALSVQLAGSYNRLRASFGASWSSSVTKNINREDV